MTTLSIHHQPPTLRFAISEKPQRGFLQYEWKRLLGPRQFGLMSFQFRLNPL